MPRFMLSEDLILVAKEGFCQVLLRLLSAHTLFLEDMKTQLVLPSSSDRFARTQSSPMTHLAADEKTGVALEQVEQLATIQSAAESFTHKKMAAICFAQDARALKTLVADFVVSRGEFSKTFHEKFRQAYKLFIDFAVAKLNLALQIHELAVNKKQHANILAFLRALYVYVDSLECPTDNSLTLGSGIFWERLLVVIKTSLLPDVNDLTRFLHVVQFITDHVRRPDTDEKEKLLLLACMPPFEMLLRQKLASLLTQEVKTAKSQEIACLLAFLEEHEHVFISNDRINDLYYLAKLVNIAGLLIRLIAEPNESLLILIVDEIKSISRFYQNDMQFSQYVLNNPCMFDLLGKSIDNREERAARKAQLLALHRAAQTFPTYGRTEETRKDAERSVYEICGKIIDVRSLNGLTGDFGDHFVHLLRQSVSPNHSLDGSELQKTLHLFAQTANQHALGKPCTELVGMLQAQYSMLRFAGNPYFVFSLDLKPNGEIYFRVRYEVQGLSISIVNEGDDGDVHTEYDPVVFSITSDYAVFDGQIQLLSIGTTPQLQSLRSVGSLVGVHSVHCLVESCLPSLADASQDHLKENFVGSFITSVLRGAGHQLKSRKQHKTKTQPRPSSDTSTAKLLSGESPDIQRQVQPARRRRDRAVTVSGMMKKYLPKGVLEQQLQHAGSLSEFGLAQGGIQEQIALPVVESQDFARIASGSEKTGVSITRPRGRQRAVTSAPSYKPNESKPSGSSLKFG